MLLFENLPDPLGTTFDEKSRGRVGSAGYVTSGRRWHRRIPLFSPGSGAAVLIMSHRLIAVAVLAALIATTGACAHAFGSATIADLRSNPGRYQHHSVSINGIVTSAYNLPLVPYKLYKVDDGTGEVTVLSQNGRTPTRGANVRVKGRVDDVAVLGGRAMGLHLREQSLYVKR
jgi:hypothetical protein